MFRIKNKVTGNLARGDLTAINGIIVHQTDSSTANQTLSYYNGANTNGAHFLIAKDGTIYQTASVYKKTYHVGKLRSKCVARSSCVPTDTRTTVEEEVAYISSLGPTARHNIEKLKTPGKRYPKNADSLGIELVGKASGSDPNNPGEKLFEAVSLAQNRSLTWLVEQLSSQFNIRLSAVYRHPTVSQKTPSEASTADWRANEAP